MAEEQQQEAVTQEAAAMSETETQIETEASDTEKQSDYAVKLRHENEKRRKENQRLIAELTEANRKAAELDEIKVNALKEQNNFKALYDESQKELAKANAKLQLIDADSYLAEAEQFVENGIKTLDDVHRDLIDKCSSVVEKRKFLERLAAKKAESAPREQKPAGSISFSAPKNRKEFEQLSPVEQDKFAAEHPDELKKILRT